MTQAKGCVVSSLLGWLVPFSLLGHIWQIKKNVRCTGSLEIREPMNTLLGQKYIPYSEGDTHTRTEVQLTLPEHSALMATMGTTSSCGQHQLPSIALSPEQEWPDAQRSSPSL